MERKIKVLYQALGPNCWHVGQGCWRAARDGLDRETFIRVRLDVGRRLSRFDVKIRRNQRKNEGC
jgi:hypothetical protein